MAGQAHFLTSTATPRSRARVFSSWASCIIRAKPGGGGAEEEGRGQRGLGRPEAGLRSWEAGPHP